MIEQTGPSLWFLTCPECDEREAIVEIPVDAEPGTGITRCRNEHDFLFQFDGLTVKVLGP